MNVENKVYKVTAPFYGGIVAAFLFFACDLNMNLINSKRAVRDFPDISLSKGEKYWWYSYPKMNDYQKVTFKVGDHVVLLNDKIAQILGEDEGYLFVKVRDDIKGHERTDVVIEKNFVKGNSLNVLSF